LGLSVPDGVVAEGLVVGEAQGLRDRFAGQAVEGVVAVVEGALLGEVLGFDDLGAVTGRAEGEGVALDEAAAGRVVRAEVRRRFRVS
jgi:hypothetical protein